MPRDVIRSIGAPRRALATASGQVALAATLLAIAIIVVFAQLEWSEYRNTKARAHNVADKVAGLLGEHAALNVAAIDTTLRAVARLRGDVARFIYRTRDSIYVNLRTLRSGAPILREIGWYQDNGALAASSTAVAPEAVSAGEQAFFATARDAAGDELYVSAPSRRSGADPWQLIFSRRIEGLAGEFAGVAYGMAEAHSFAAVFESLDLGPGYAVALMRADGTVLARTPEDGMIGQRQDIGLLRSALAGADGGTFRRRGDDDAYVVGFKRVPGTANGLIVQVEIGERAAFAEFWRSFLSGAFVAAAALSAIVVGGAMLVGGLRRRERLQADLAAATVAANAARAEAESANRAKSRFLANMSHELRTPLNAVIGFAQMLQLQYFGGSLTPRQREYVGHILHSGEHLLDLVNQILDLAGVEAGRLQLTVQPIDIGEALREVGETMAPAAAKASVVLITEPGSAPAVSGDPGRLRQVLLNLVGNAIKYNKVNGRVIVTARAIDDAVRVQVSDTGIGIPVQQQRHLFEPFHRLGAEYTAVEGTGLGLALSRQLIQAMGGRIGVSSVPGEGSEFWFELPAAASAASPRQVEPTARLRA